MYCISVDWCVIWFICRDGHCLMWPQLVVHRNRFLLFFCLMNHEELDGFNPGQNCWFRFTRYSITCSNTQHVKYHLTIVSNCNEIIQNIQIFWKKNTMYFVTFQMNSVLFDFVVAYSACLIWINAKHLTKHHNKAKILINRILIMIEMSICDTYHLAFA